jgi:hypothetical protein
VPLALAGCVSDEEQRSMDQDKCYSFGFQPGTDALANCMMNQSAQRNEDEQRSLDRMNEQEWRDKDRKRKHHRKDKYVDSRPSFDRDGNPNFDKHGRYQGCNGMGCMVDNPDD